MSDDGYLVKRIDTLLERYSRQKLSHLDMLTKIVVLLEAMARRIDVLDRRIDILERGEDEGRG